LPNRSAEGGNRLGVPAFFCKVAAVAVRCVTLLNRSADSRRISQAHEARDKKENRKHKVEIGFERVLLQDALAEILPGLVLPLQDAVANELQHLVLGDEGTQGGAGGWRRQCRVCRIRL
jgi:hypothetical protein